MSVTRYIARALTKYPILNLCIVFIFTLIAIVAIFRLRFDTSLAAFVIKDDPDMVYYNKVKEMFGTDETIVIGFGSNDLFSKEGLEFVKRISDKIGDIEYVSNVRSLTTANLTVATPDMFEIKGLVDKMPETPEESRVIKHNATTNYLYIKDLNSVDGRYASILVDIKNDPEKNHTQEVVDFLKILLKKESANTGYKIYLGGDAIINYSLGEYMKNDLFRFMAPLYILIAVLLIMTIGRPRDILIALSYITITLIWATGAISLLGKTVNNVTTGLIPLILCLGLESIYYFHSYYYDNLKLIQDPRQAFEKALNELLAPAFFCSFTTVVGFVSLMVNDVKPIFDFGLIGCLAVAMDFVIVCLFVPSVHILMKMPKDLDRRPALSMNSISIFAKRGNFIEKYKKFFWVAIPAIIIFSVIGITKMKIETDHLAFFHKNSDVYKATTFLEKNLGGVSNIEILVEADKDDMIKEPKVLAEIDRLVNFVRQQEKVDKVMSIIDFLKDMNRAQYDNDESYYKIPETREAVAQYLLLYSMASRRNDIEKDFVDYHYRIARIRCRISEHNSAKILALVKRIKNFAGSEMSPSLKVKITSYPVIYSNMVDSLSRGQFGGMALGVIMLSICAIIYFRSSKLGVLVMIPNVIPILFTFGMMGYTGITLNIGTAMTCGIAIGIAMDDTTYQFTRFLKEVSKNHNYAEAMKRTLFALGEPMTYSSMLMIAGYLVLMFSQFHLTVLFGALCAFTILTALLCDLLITPWIFITFKPRLKNER